MGCGRLKSKNTKPMQTEQNNNDVACVTENFLATPPHPASDPNQKSQIKIQKSAWMGGNGCCDTNPPIHQSNNPPPTALQHSTTPPPSALHHSPTPTLQHSSTPVLRGRQPGCGKTTAFDVLTTLLPRPVRTENIKSAVLFRLVDQHHPPSSATLSRPC
jgi:hypothetical protein